MRNFYCILQMIMIREAVSHNSLLLSIFVRLCQCLKYRDVCEDKTYEVTLISISAVC